MWCWLRFMLILCLRTNKLGFLIIFMKYLQIISLCKIYTKVTGMWVFGVGHWLCGMGRGIFVVAGGDPWYWLKLGCAMFGMFVGIMYGVARSWGPASLSAKRSHPMPMTTLVGTLGH